MSEQTFRWKEVRLADVCEINPRDPGPTKASSHVSFIPMPAVCEREGKITKHDTKPFLEVAKGYTRFRDGDIIFAKITPCMENGKIAIADGLHNGFACGSTEFHVLRPNGAILPRYLWHFMRQHSFRQDAERHMTGAVGQRRVPIRYIEDALIPLPSLAEQRHLLDKLDSFFARSMNARNELNHLPRLVERYKQSILTAAFRGDITKSWRSTNIGTAPDKERIDRERRAVFGEGTNYKSPVSAPSDDPPFNIPREWSWLRAEALCDFITKGTTPPSSAMTPEIGDIPYIKVYNLTFNGRLDFSVEPTFVSKETHQHLLKRSKVIPGDVLMNIVGPPLGKVSIVPSSSPEWNINQAIAVFRPVRSLDRRFLAYWLLSDQLLNWAVSRSKATAGQSNLTLQICRDMPIPLCSAKEQGEICDRIEDAFKRIEKLATESIRANDLVDRLEQATLAKAFRGELIHHVKSNIPHAENQQPRRAALR